MFPFYKINDHQRDNSYFFEFLQRFLSTIFWKMANNLRFYEQCQKILLNSEDFDLRELFRQISEQQEIIQVTKKRFFLFLKGSFI